MGFHFNITCLGKIPIAAIDHSVRTRKKNELKI